jgi:hypothetical protein
VAGVRGGAQGRDAVDFNDLVGKVVELFQQHPDVLQKWRDRFQYVLVDEYQDTNRAQYLLLRLLADESRNLAVVGDDDQSIYGFRGADISNILNFQKDYPEAKVIRLEQNYRSTGHILTVANVLVAQNTGRLEKKLWTQSPAGARVQFVLAKDVRTEAVRVIDAIQKVRRMGTTYGQIAVIYRTNALARPFEVALTQARIPFRVVGGKKFYERREVRDVLAYLRVLTNPADDAAFLRIVNVPPRGIGAKTQTDLRTDAQGRGQPLLATARTRAVGTSVGDKGLAAVVKLFDELDDAARDAGLEGLVVTLLDRSGYRAMLEADAAPPPTDPDARPRRGPQRTGGPRGQGAPGQPRGAGPHRAGLSGAPRRERDLRAPDRLARPGRALGGHRRAAGGWRGHAHDRALVEGPRVPGGVRGADERADVPPRAGGRRGDRGGAAPRLRRVHAGDAAPGGHALAAGRPWRGHAAVALPVRPAPGRARRRPPRRRAGDGGPPGPGARGGADPGPPADLPGAPPDAAHGRPDAARGASSGGAVHGDRARVVRPAGGGREDPAPPNTGWGRSASSRVACCSCGSRRSSGGSMCRARSGSWWTDPAPSGGSRAPVPADRGVTATVRANEHAGDETCARVPPIRSSGPSPPEPAPDVFVPPEFAPPVLP